MVSLRLKRMGCRNNPFYRIVAVDSRLKRDGKYIEALGYYDPKTNPYTINIDQEKAIKWINYGAKPSVTVRALFKKVGVLSKVHEMKYGADNTEKAEATE